MRAMRPLDTRRLRPVLWPLHMQHCSIVCIALHGMYCSIACSIVAHRHVCVQDKTPPTRHAPPSWRRPGQKRSCWRNNSCRNRGTAARAWQSSRAHAPPCRGWPLAAIRRHRRCHSPGRKPGPRPQPGQSPRPCAQPALSGRCSARPARDSSGGGDSGSDGVAQEHGVLVGQPSRADLCARTSAVIVLGL